MNLIDKIIFWQSRKLPHKMRELLGLLFLFSVRARNFLRYEDKNLFHHVNIELSRNCNRKCSYCPVSKYPNFGKQEKLDFNVFRKLINELKKIDFRGEVHFTGYYEPLLEKELFKYINFTRKNLKKAKIVVYTNGDFLNKKTMKKMEELSILLIITLHDKNNEKKYEKIKEITKSSDVVIKENIENHTLSSRGGLVNVKKKERKQRCILPSVELTIDYKGNIILCADDFFSKHSFGNIEKESILEIWNKEKFKKTRKNLLSKRMDYKICRSCLF